MLKRLMYIAALAGVGMLSMGCSWWPYGADQGLPRIIAAILREDIFG